MAFVTRRGARLAAVWNFMLERIPKAGNRSSVQNARQNKDLERRSDSIGSDTALGAGADPALEDAQRVLYESGLANRRAVLGDDWVEASLARLTPFTADFQAMITRYAWQEVWGRPGLDHRTRRLLVVAITASLGRWEEFRLHVRAGLSRGGFSREELKETLMQTAIYAGVPAANTAFAEAAAVISALDDEAASPKNS